MTNKEMGTSEMLEMASAPESLDTEVDVLQTNLFSVKLRTCVVSANGLEIRVVNMSNVLSFSCICLTCGEECFPQSSLDSHSKSHLQSDDFGEEGASEFADDKIPLDEEDSAGHEGENPDTERTLDHDSGMNSSDSKSLDEKLCSSNPDGQIVPVKVETARQLDLTQQSPGSVRRASAKQNSSVMDVGSCSVKMVSLTDKCRPSGSTDQLRGDTQKLMKKSKQMSRKKDPSKCNICGKIFRLRRSLVEHMNQHTGEKPFVCDICGKAYDRKSKLTVHCRIHKGGNHSCQECGKRFVKASGLNDHSKVHTGEKPNLCPICGKRFRLAGQVTIHMKIHSMEKPHKCSSCGKTFSRASYLAKHSRMHQDVCLMCSVCGKSFKYATGLNQHMRTEHGDRQMMKCDVCGKIMKGWKSFKEHRSRHNGEKSFTCSECSKQFRVKSDLTAHQRIHAKEKQYWCSECGKCFCQKFYFEEHSRIHTGEKPLKCSHCGQTFRVRAALRKHLKTEHQDTRASEASATSSGPAFESPLYSDIDTWKVNDTDHDRDVIAADELCE